MPRRQSTKTKTAAKPQSKHILGLPARALSRIGFGLVLALLAWGLYLLLQPDPEEAPYSSVPQIDRVQLLPGEDFASERIVSWRCGDSLAASELILSYQVPKVGKHTKGKQTQHIRYQAQGQLVKTSGGQAAYYRVLLDSLRPDTEYSYYLRSGQQHSGPYQFRTPIEAADSLQFAYLGDFRGRHRDKLLSSLSSQLPQLDFIALAGNLWSQPSDTAWQDWYQALGASSSSIPLITVAGTGSYRKEYLGHTLDPRWSAQYPYSSNGPADYLGRSYYIDFPYMRLVVVDAAELISWSGIRSHTQWLRQVLDLPERKWRIVLLHLPVDRIVEGKQHLVMHYFLRDEIIAAGADLILQGHEPSYGRATLRSASGDSIAPLLVVSPASPEQGRNNFDSSYDRLATGIALYQQIVVSRSSIHYRSYRFGSAPRDSIAARDSLYDEVLLKRLPEGGVRIIDKARYWPELFLLSNFGSSKREQKKAAQYQSEVDKRNKQRKEAQKGGRGR